MAHQVHYDLDQDDKNMIVGNKRRHIRLKFKDQETLEEWASKLVDAIKMVRTDQTLISPFTAF